MRIIAKTFEKSNWRGKRLLEKMELFSFFLFYTLIIVIPLVISKLEGTMGIQIVIWIIVGIVIYIIIFVAFQQYVLRRIADKYNGIPVMTGWMDQEEGLGEKYEFIIEKITPFDRLSEVEKKSVESWIDKDLIKKISEFDKQERDTKNLLELKPEGFEPYE